MLVAQRQEYEELYYPSEIEKQQSQPASRPKKVSKPKAKPGRRLLHLAMIMIGFGICAFTVARYAMIAQNQQEILELEKTLEKQQSIQEYMKLELAARGNLKKIEEYAKNELEMDYPDDDQILFVELPDMDTNKEEDAPTHAEQKEDLWSKILGLLD